GGWTAGAPPVSIDPNRAGPVRAGEGGASRGKHRPGPRPQGMRTMPLHHRDIVRNRLTDCVFVGRDLTKPVPKYRFPQDSTVPGEAFQVVSDELMLDGNARQNLATFCQTWEEPEQLALL